MATKAITTYTFAVTFESPHGATIKDAREFLKAAMLTERNALNPDEVFKDLEMGKVKVHLINKETSYGKR